MPPNIKGAIAENFTARCATSGFFFKENLPTWATVRATVGNQHCRISSRILAELRESADCANAGNCGAVIREDATACGRSIEELREAAGCATRRSAIIAKDATACGRSIPELRGSAECASRRSAAIDEGATACGRSIVELRESAHF